MGHIFFKISLILLIFYFLRLIFKATKNKTIELPLYILLFIVLILGHFDIIHHNVVGLIGVLLALPLTLFLNLGMLSPDNINYPLMEVFSSLLIGFSLLSHFNLSAFILEVFYGVVALIGIIRILSKKPSVLSS